MLDGLKFALRLEIEAHRMNEFRVGFSADFLDESRRLVFPDIGLGLLENVAGLSYEFMADYRPVYGPEQLAGYDVVISAKPRVALESLTRRPETDRDWPMWCRIRQR